MAEERRLHSTGEFLQAISAFDQILELKPVLGDTIITWLWLRRRGLAYERAGEAEKATEDYKEAIRLAVEWRGSGCLVGSHATR